MIGMGQVGVGLRWGVGCRDLRGVRVGVQSGAVFDAASSWVVSLLALSMMQCMGWLGSGHGWHGAGLYGVPVGCSSA